MMTDEKTAEAEAIESSAFEALEKDFQEVLQELIGDKSLEHFRLEYEKLHRALKKSHESEKRLIKKCRELNHEIVSNATKVQTALQLSKEDQTTIGNLKKEIERAWKMVEASSEKEQRAKETIQNLKVEIQNLSQLVEQGAGLSVNQENTVNSLMQQRDELQRNRDLLEARVQNLTQQNIGLSETVQKHQAEKVQGEVEIMNITDVINAKKTEQQREHRRRERLEKELHELRANMQQRDKTLADVKATIKQQEEQKELFDRQLKELKKVVETRSSEEAKLINDIGDQKAENARLIQERKGIHAENLALNKEYKAAGEEMKTSQQELDKTQKQYDQLKRRVNLDDDERHELQLTRAVLKSDAENLLRETEQLRHQVDSDNKAIAELMRERESVNRSLCRTNEKTTKHTDEVKLHEARTQSLQKDVSRVKHDLQDSIKECYHADKDREKSGVELSLAGRHHQAALEDLKNRDNKISELKKSYADAKGKLADQKQQYEAVRTERNLFSKNLVESQDEIAEMKRKFKIMYHQIEQLKEEIKEKQEALRLEKTQENEVKKECDQLKKNMEGAKKKQSLLNSQKDTQQAEIKKLENRIQEADAERNKKKREYEEKISERDVLGTQLIRRNDELALHYEKIKIQQRTLQRGEIAYKQRLEESRNLMIKTASLKRELHIGMQQVSSIDDLKKEVFQLQRELLQERTKVKALSEELENPMNVHRWRKLEGQDPAMNEMFQKVQALQKRLISKTEEAVEKDLTIQEKEKYYLEMQNLLDKQPPQSVVEEVGKQQQALKLKTTQMKAMAAELNMYHAQLNDYKDEIERLTRELQDTKRKYFEHKHREQLLKDTSVRQSQDKQAPTARG
jgi:chromosome segregation ATPase